MSNNTSAASGDENPDNITGSGYNGNTRATILQAFMWFYTFIGLYVLTSLIMYERALHKQRRHESVTHLLEGSKGSPQRYGIYLRTVNIFAALILVCRTIVEHAEILLEIHSDGDYCYIVVTLKICLAGLFFTAIYLFLWIRQRMCYSNPLMGHLTSTFTHALSWASLVGLLITEVVTVGLFVITRRYKRTSLGCNVDTTYIPPFLVWVVYGITTATFQITFLILFILPLLRQRKLMRDRNVSYKKRAHKVVPLIRRSFYACLVCVVTNLLVSVILILPAEEYNVIPIVLYNFNLVVNLLAVVASFSKWRIILVPCGNRGTKIASLDDTRGFDKDFTGSSRRDAARRNSLLLRLTAERQSSVFTITNPGSSVLEEFSTDGRGIDATHNLIDVREMKNEFQSVPSPNLPPIPCDDSGESNMSFHSAHPEDVK